MSYEQSAPVYDAIYTKMKDYQAESERVRELIEANAQIPVRTLADYGCGTGLHDEYLCSRYHVTCIDLSEAQLEIARRRLRLLIWDHGTLPNFRLELGDMRTYQLTRPVDAIVCLFSAIGHLQSVAELQQTIANFADNLQPGGVILIEPWLLPDMWLPGRISMETANLPDLKVARMSRSSRSGNVIHLELEHLVCRPEGNEHFVETHDLTMFSQREFSIAFAKVGLDAHYDPAGINTNGRGIFVATKPLS